MKSDKLTANNVWHFHLAWNDNDCIQSLVSCSLHDISKYSVFRRIPQNHNYYITICFESRECTVYSVIGFHFYDLSTIMTDTTNTEISLMHHVST